MYYYTRLGGLSRKSSAVKIFVLSCLTQRKGNRRRLCEILGISRMGLWKVLKELQKEGLINDRLDIIEIQEENKIPYVKLNTKLIKHYGLKITVYLSWRTNRRNADKLTDEQAAKETGLSLRTIYRCKKELINRGVLKDGELICENIFRGTPSKTVEECQEHKRKEHREMLAKKDSKTSSRLQISFAFMDACKECGYDVPPPTVADVAKAYNIQKSFEEHNYDVSVTELIEYLVTKWDTLDTLKGRLRRPEMPVLGLLPVYYKEICAKIKEPKIEVVE